MTIRRLTVEDEDAYVALRRESLLEAPRRIAGALIDAAIAHARTMDGVEWVQLSVSVACPDARRVYERAGFAVWGREEDAMRVNGQAFDEDYMALRLR